MSKRLMTQRSRIALAASPLTAPMLAYAHHDEPAEHIWHEIAELLSHPEVLALALAAVAGVWWLVRRRRNAKREGAH